MLKYITYYPNEYKTNETKLWPLIFFLHGVGERGDNPDIVRRNGLPKTIEAGMEIPFVVIAPQCPKDGRWEPLPLKMLLDEVLEKFRIDKTRVYLTGLSMGGFGTFRFAMQFPYCFAAIAPICGGGYSNEAWRIKHIPCWVFHGAKDNVVPLIRSQEVVKELEKFGADVRFTIYPDAEHDSWTETYANPELYQWFLKYSLKKE